MSYLINFTQFGLKHGGIYIFIYIHVLYLFGADFLESGCDVGKELNRDAHNHFIV